MVDLIPQEVQMQKIVEAQGREVFRAAVLSILVMFFIGVGLGSLVFFKKAELNKLKTNYQDVSDKTAQLKRVQATSHMITTYMQDRMLGLEVMKTVNELLPRTVYLNSLVLGEDGVINIQGVSDVGSTVYSFGSTLEEHELFRKARVKSTTAKKDRGKDATGFEIAITLASAEPETEGLSED
jgi:Tfp pilus assembly protein PilN